MQPRSHGSKLEAWERTIRFAPSWTPRASASSGKRELLGDCGIDPSERARRCHEHAAGVHREAADLHQRAADLFEAHAVEFSPTKPLRAKSARRLADEERRLSAVERDAANREQAEADGLEDLGDPRHGRRQRRGAR